MSGPEHFRIQEIGPGIHFAEATAAGYGLCNSGIVDLGGVGVVFDSMLTPQAGSVLGKTAQRLLGRPIDLLVNSHYHGDHVRGNGAVGAGHIVSTHRTRELIRERASALLATDRQQAAGELEGLRSGRIPAPPQDREVYEGWYRGILETPADWTVAPPDLTFTGELVVRGSRREARIVSWGGGHTESDVFLYLPAERTIFLGDLLSIGFHPCLWDGNASAFARLLERILELPIDRAVPGHGPLGSRADVRTMLAYVELLRGWARTGEGSEVGKAPPEPFDGWAFRNFFELNRAFVARTTDAPVAP